MTEGLCILDAANSGPVGQDLTSISQGTDRLQGLQTHSWSARRQVPNTQRQLRTAVLLLRYRQLMLAHNGEVYFRREFKCGIEAYVGIFGFQEFINKDFQEHAWNLRIIQCHRIHADLSFAAAAAGVCHYADFMHAAKY